ncbi:hypothetical protein ACE1ET_15390 [Saccharicrinis sp. FJH62]|uniref:hypothetical protein n=1 Tax=Saccharicrinis sp. FJH62 TaxID=3344657 RepID=UPI0035D4DA1D
MKNETNKNGSVNLESLVGRLRNEDQRYSRLSKGIQIVYFVLLPIYVLLLIVHIIEGSTWYEIFGSVCFALSMLIFALFFRRYYKEYKYVDYAQPTLSMLKDAAFRYQPFQWRMIWLVLALFFMDIGLSLTTFQMAYTVLVQILFLGSLGIATIIGYIIWWFRYRPLRMDTLKLIKEIEED